MILRPEKEEAVVLYSKLDLYGPAKDRAHIATPDAILTKLHDYYPKKVRNARFELKPRNLRPKPAL